MTIKKCKKSRANITKNNAFKSSRTLSLAQLNPQCEPSLNTFRATSSI